jgi:hypothetical protein
MAKWADYLISHVKKDSNGNVMNVLLHIDKGETISLIGVKTKDEVITLLAADYSVKTIIWGYPLWQQGAEAHIVRDNSGEYLRTKGNKTDRDNLDNLIPLY